MTIPPELLKLIVDLEKRNATKISLGDVEPLADFAEKLESDNDFMEFLTSLPTQLIARVGIVSPPVLARIQKLLELKETPLVQDDNRFERTYDEE